jgi:hypothetical protein
MRTTCYWYKFTLFTIIRNNLSHIKYRAVITQTVQHWAKGWKIGVLGFGFRLGLGICLFTTASRPALGPTRGSFVWGKAAGA